MNNMPGDNPIHVSGRGVAVFLGVVCVVGGFSGLAGFWGGVGLVLLGAILILLGVR